MKIKELLGRSTFMMSLALIVALLLAFTDTFPLDVLTTGIRSKSTIIILAVMMTVSLSRIPNNNLNPAKDPKSIGRAMILGIVIAAAIPLTASFFFDDPNYKAGLVFIAVTPFAASVVPLSYIMRGDMIHAARSTLIIYALSILYIPLIAYLTLGELVPILEVIKAVVFVVLIPLLVSRFLTGVKIDKTAMGIFLNFCIFMLVFLSVGATGQFFKSEPVLLLTFMGIAFLRTFCLGIGLEYIEKKRGIPWEQRVTDVLMTSYKNKGIAIALATAIGAAAAMPALLFPITASIIVEICWVIFMDSVLLSPGRMKRELAREGRSDEIRNPGSD